MESANPQNDEMMPWTGCCWSSESPSVCTNSSLSHPPARPCLGPGNQGNQLHGCTWELAFCWGKCPWDKAGNYSWPFMAAALHFPGIPLPNAPICAGGWGEGEFISLISSGLFLTLLLTLRVWNVGFGLWAHVPASLPTLPANAGQAREELLPSLSSSAGLEILVPKERSGIP